MVTTDPRISELVYDTLHISVFLSVVVVIHLCLSLVEDRFRTRQGFRRLVANKNSSGLTLPPNQRVSPCYA